MKLGYYSLTTKTKEICIEPLLGGDAYLAEYDLRRDLLKDKLLIHMSDAPRFMLEIETEENEKFIFIDL